MVGLVGAEFKGGEGLSLLFRRLEDQLQSERILDAAAALLLDRTRKRFLDEVDPNEVPWQESLSAQEENRGTLFGIDIPNVSDGGIPVGLDDLSPDDESQPGIQV